MKRISTLILILCTALVSCTKDELPAPAPADPVNDKRTILLKEVVEQGLPSPYFHFTYDTGYVSNINFASGLYQYEVTYKNNRVSHMRNAYDGSILKYYYQNGNVTHIRKWTGNAHVWTYEMFYDDNRLKSVKYHRMMTDIDSVLERQVNFAYHNDGNLAVYKDFWLNPTNHQMELSRMVVFKDYDTGKNVDDFYVFKQFFEDVLFLPQVKLQKNNPGTVEYIGGQKDYEIKYTYTYQNSLPTRKDGVLRQIGGDSPPPPTNLWTTFTYY